MGEKKKQEDDLVNVLTGEGPELPGADASEADALDPAYLERMKRTSANQASLVRGAMRRRLDEGSAEVSSASASKVDSKSEKEKRQGEDSGMLGMRACFGDLGSSDPESSG